MRTVKHALIEAYKCFLFVILLTCFLVLTGCADTAAILQAADYGCANIEVDGPYTDSGARGRAIWLPEGVELTQETIEGLCP